MNIKAQRIRLGIFIVTGASILLFMIAYFTARELFTKSDLYYISFKDVSVSGMEVGSQVKYMGIKVGTISDIVIDPEDVTNIIVSLSLKTGTPVKEDSKADITTLGITGLKAIEIRGGTNESKLLQPGSYIQSGSSFADEITGKAEVIAIKAEQVVNNLLRLTQAENTEKLMSTIESYHSLATNADRAVIRIDSLLKGNEANINATLASVRKLSASLEESSLALNSSLNKISGIVANDSINLIIANIWEVSEKLKSSDINAMIDDLAMVSAQLRQLLSNMDQDLDKGSRDMVESFELLKSTLSNLEEASRKINANPSVLRRSTSSKDAPDKHLKQ